MKILFPILLILLIVLLGCTAKPAESLSESESSAASQFEQEPSSSIHEEVSSDEKGLPTAGDTAVFGNSFEIALELSAKFDGTDVVPMDSDQIGALEGTSFKVGEDRFEIYKFENSEDIKEAETGKFTVNIGGMGESEYNSAKNGNYLLLSRAENEDIFNTFMKYNLSA